MTEVEAFLSSSQLKCVGLTGSAGAGKSTLSRSLASAGYTSYSIDWRFVGDSQFRKQLLIAKAGNSIHSYIDACNQFNWWDWNQVLKDLESLLGGSSIFLDAYDRDSGIYKKAEITNNAKGLVVEGALLGPESMIQIFETIIFVFTPAKIRLQRLIEKDSGRRRLNEIVARFLITEYSESTYYRKLFEAYRDRVLIVNNSGKFVTLPNDSIDVENFIPLPA